MAIFNKVAEVFLKRVFCYKNVIYHTSWKSLVQSKSLMKCIYFTLSMWPLEKSVQELLVLKPGVQKIKSKENQQKNKRL